MSEERTAGRRAPATNRATRATRAARTSAATDGATLDTTVTSAATDGATLDTTVTGLTGMSPTTTITGVRPTRPMPVLTAKLTVPPVPEATMVVRDRLFDRLDAGLAGPVTLVSAPAGWGKTVLLASWYRSGRPSLGGTMTTAWLTIEPDDQAAGRLRSYLFAALGADAATTATTADRAGADGRPALERLAAILLNRPGPMVLVLDDLHRADAPNLAEDLRFLSRHAGDRLRLVISTRTGHNLSLHQWRLSGELTEILPTELAFTGEESAELLAAHQALLPMEQVRALHGRTEGWPAGLRLAALALRDRPDPIRCVAGFTGDSEPVAAYLRHEVLSAAADDAWEALTRGAVAEQLCGGLLDVLTGRADGDELLADVSRATGFMIPIDAPPGTYRCHRMLHDLLRAGLRRLPPDERRDLHRRAAGWYGAHGQPVPALRHALAAGDDDQARRLFRDHWADLVPYCSPASPAPSAADVGPLPPPPASAEGDPVLALAYAAERLSCHDPAPAAHHLRLAGEDGPVPGDRQPDRPGDGQPDGPGDGHPDVPGDGQPDWFGDARPAWFGASHAGLRLALAQLAGDTTAAETAAERLHAFAGAVPGAAAIARTVLGSIRFGDGDLPAAERQLADGLTLAGRTGPPRARLLCAGWLALTHAVWGRLRAAEDAARTALDDAIGGDDPVDLGYAHLARAVIALHRDLPDDVRASLSLVDQHLDRIPEPVVGVLVAVVRARSGQDRGDLPGAGEALLHGRRYLTGRPPGWPPADWLLAAEVDLRTASGEPQAVRDLWRRTGEAAEPSPSLAVALARSALAGGDFREAERLLPQWSGAAGQTCPLALRIEAGVLDAAAVRSLGDERGAARRLEEVLELAQPEGFRRVFTQAEPPVRELLTAHLDSGTAYWPLVMDLLGERERRAELPAAPGRGVVPQAIREPLTERELTILRYLQSILSNVEIAAELSLSVNTVKTHVRNIYRKLETSRRREAVRRARELHLI